MNKERGRLELALEVHGRLSALIAPATPESIRASSIRANYTLIGIIFGGIASFTAYIAAPILGAGDSESAKVLGAAGLGATFFALYTASKYLRERTYDPQHNQAYVIRFALGVFAGFILGNAGPEFFSGMEKGRLGATTLAFVGGFAAEAVAQILQRVADALVAVVRGGGKEQAKNDAEKQVMRKSSQIAGNLQEALNDPDTLADRVRQVIAELLR